MTATETTQPGQRWIDLDGADNMRDLGGLEVTGGGRTRFDRLLRSGTLQDLTADDVSYLVKDVGVHTVTVNPLTGAVYIANMGDETVSVISG